MQKQITMALITHAQRRIARHKQLARRFLGLSRPTLALLPRFPLSDIILTGQLHVDFCS